MATKLSTSILYPYWLFMSWIDSFRSSFVTQTVQHNKDHLIYTKHKVWFPKINTFKWATFKYSWSTTQWTYQLTKSNLIVHACFLETIKMLHCTSLRLNRSIANKVQTKWTHVSSKVQSITFHFCFLQNIRL